MAQTLPTKAEQTPPKMTAAIKNETTHANQLSCQTTLGHHSAGLPMHSHQIPGQQVQG